MAGLSEKTRIGDSKSENIEKRASSPRHGRYFREETRQTSQTRRVALGREDRNRREDEAGDASRDLERG